MNLRCHNPFCNCFTLRFHEPLPTQLMPPDQFHCACCVVVSEILGFEIVITEFTVVRLAIGHRNEILASVQASVDETLQGHNRTVLRRSQNVRSTSIAPLLPPHPHSPRHPRWPDR